MNILKVKVAADQVGRTALQLTKSYNSKISPSRLYKAFRKGEVRLNGSRVKFSYRLQEGDVLRIPVYQPVAKIEANLPDFIANSILAEDEHLIVINKPAGLAVHAGSHGDEGLIEILRQDPRWINLHLDLVHRLDKDTSGVLLVAKTARCKKLMAEKFKSREISKIYLAILVGHLDKNIKTLQHNLVNEYTKVVISPKGKVAITEILHIEHFHDKNSNPLTRVTLKPKTGRKHQLRVQCQTIGHPIVGDPIYGKKIREKIFLHAYKLCYIDPFCGKVREFTAQPPKGRQFDYK